MVLSLRESAFNEPVEVWEMLQEIGPGENGFNNRGSDVAFEELPNFLKKLVDMSRGIGLQPDLVPMTTYWMFADGKPVGISKLRHYLNEGLLRNGGHIGYCIRPTERGKGYGRQILALTLEKAREKGIEKALITVYQDNAVSCKVVLSNGGKLEKIKDGLGYYWIELKS